MKAAGAVLLSGAAVLLGGCSTTETWPEDRPWLDPGCFEPGHCAVRGRLERPTAATPNRGVLRLDDGGCLYVDLPRGVLRRGDKWWDRRVAIRGVAVTIEERAILPVERCAGSLLLYAERLSLKADR